MTGPGEGNPDPNPISSSQLMVSKPKSHFLPSPTRFSQSNTKGLLDYPICGKGRSLKSKEQNTTGKERD